MINMGLMVIGGIATLVGMFISNRLKSKFEFYSQYSLRNGMSGREIAETMLRHYGIYDVKVQLSEGFLSDHYNPVDKTVNLSEPVYNARSISAAAVAAHECGHAVQHATAYAPLQFRSAIVPVVKVSSGLQQFIFMAAIFTIGSSLGKTLLLITLITFGVTALFSLVTLPVEFDASKRALAWLESTNMTTTEEHEGAKDALWWAAMTYVASAMAALASFLYLLWEYNRR
ncbi:MAG: zinc metallopeptidase [Saprospiraceae bacterium]|nr:zinc metallopeptidase [Saprospiraceae bacterium]